VTVDPESLLFWLRMASIRVEYYRATARGTIARGMAVAEFSGSNHN
jgi:hypothetical protein